MPTMVDEPSALEDVAPRERRQRNCHRDLLSQDGPPALAIVVAVDGGRWHRELSRNDGPACNVLRLLHQRLDTSGADQMPRGNGSCVVGMVVLRSWRYMWQASVDELTMAFIDAARAARKRCSSVAFVQYPVLAAARTISPFVVQPGAILDPPATSGALLLHELESQGVACQSHWPARSFGHSGCFFSKRGCSIGRLNLANIYPSSRGQCNVWLRGVW